MEVNQIINLIQTVSNSNLSSFTYEEGDCRLSLKKHEKTTVIENNAIHASNDITTEVEQSNRKSQSDQIIIESPMVGTFYAAKSENSEPYIGVGDVVKKGQIVGIIEAMKLMNEVESEYDGVVEEILVNNQDVVEFGQPLIVLKPIGS